MRRRTFIAGAGAAGAAWVTPEVLLAKPAAGALLSVEPGGPGPANVPTLKAPATEGPEKPLAFTGDNIEQTAGIGSMLVGAGWLLTRWRAGDAKRLPE